jgi:hypothetical protein
LQKYSELQIRKEKQKNVEDFGIVCWYTTGVADLPKSPSGPIANGTGLFFISINCISHTFSNISRNFSIKQLVRRL